MRWKSTTIESYQLVTRIIISSQSWAWLFKKESSVTSDCASEGYVSEILDDVSEVLGHVYELYIMHLKFWIMHLNFRLCICASGILDVSELHVMCMKHEVINLQLQATDLRFKLCH